jgi:hypothetical protein
MAKPPVDPLRVRLTELLEAMTDRIDRLRDHAHVPGSAWLAQGELRNLVQLASQLEVLIEDIKAADEENGY